MQRKTSQGAAKRQKIMIAVTEEDSANMSVNNIIIIKKPEMESVPEMIL